MTGKKGAIRIPSVCARLASAFAEAAKSDPRVFGITQDRDSVQDIWGTRTPYKHEWPTRVDTQVSEEPDKWVQSACILCSNGCGADIGVKDGKIVGIRGRAVDRVNKGRLGPKGLNTWHINHSEDRLKYPMIRKNGKLERASWEEAMTLLTSKAKNIRDRLTGHGIGFYTSGQLFLEEYYVLALIGKAGLNTLHMDGNTRLCTATAAAAMRESFGSDGQPGSYTDIDHTDCLFIVGHNVSATQTVLWSRMLDRLDGPDPPKLIVVDPRRTNTASRASVHLAPKIGTNLALLNGLQHIMFKHGWIDREWLNNHTVGFEDLKVVVEKYSPEYTEEITGVPAALLYSAAEILGTTKTLLSTVLQGVYQSNQATASACQVNNINLLRGLIGRPGSGILQMNGQPTAQNNREAGCDGEFPGFRNYNNPAHMQTLADIWNIEFEKLPHWNQPTHINNMLTYIEQGSIEMFWISGTNPLVSLPNLPRARELLTKKDLFVVCQDIFMTETAAISDLVLPAAMWGEKTGCFTNVDRTVHLSHKAIEPPGEARSDLDIFLDFAKRMDFVDRSGDPLCPWVDSESVFEAWKKCSAGRPCDYSEMTYAKLTGGSGLQWPCDKDRPYGTERLFEDHYFFTDIEYCEDFGHDLETGAPIPKSDYMKIQPAGRAILKSCHYKSAPEQCDKMYPLQLSTGRKTHHFHTRTKTGRSKKLAAACPEPRIQLAKEDARDADIEDGDIVLVRSRRGAVQLKADVGDIAPGQTFIPFHFGYFDQSAQGPARAANELTTQAWDPVSKQPTFKAGSINVTKLSSAIDSSEVQIHAPNPQITATEEVEKTKPDAEKIGTAQRPRQRHLEGWLSATIESIRVMDQIFEDTIPRHINDPEIHGGLRVMRTLVQRGIDALEPISKSYGESKGFGFAISNDLRKSLFAPVDEKGADPFDTLITLQGLFLYMAHVQSNLVVLTPTSGAMHDKKFVAAVQTATQEVARIQAWLSEQIKVKAPQTLVVPSLTMRKEVTEKRRITGEDESDESGKRLAREPENQQKVD